MSIFVHAQTFTIPPLTEKTINVNLNQGDCVNGTFSASGGTGTGVDFTVTDPNGKKLLSYNYTSAKSFSFSASTNGNYKLSFDNSFCSCEGGKNVTLDYSVNASPQGSLNLWSNQGFAVVIVVILVVVILAVAVLVIMLRRAKTNVDNVAFQRQATRITMRYSHYE
ncbi:MAG: emp24/gp25L/p24 family protein [Candidatus Bathyarchaeia archaeon]